MLSRRELCLSSAACATSAALSRNFALASLASDGPQVGINGVTVRYLDGVWKLDAQKITIGGLPVPFSSWAWVGMTVAAGVVSAVGGLIVSLIVNLLTSSPQPNLAALLQQQLDAIAAIVVQVAKQSLVAQARGHLASDIQLIQEYQANPNGAGKRLDFLITDTSQTLGLLQQIDYAGYPTFMQMSGLRLAILQDLIAKEGKQAVAVFEQQRRDSIAFHEAIIALIDKETEPASHFPVVGQQGLLPGDPFPHTITILGKTVTGKVKYSPHTVPISGGQIGPGMATQWTLDSIANVSAAIAAGANDLIDWQALRTALKNESTNLGDGIVQEWKMAPAKIARARKAEVLRKVS